MLATATKGTTALRQPDRSSLPAADYVQRFQWLELSDGWREDRIVVLARYRTCAHPVRRQLISMRASLVAALVLIRAAAIECGAVQLFTFAIDMGDRVAGKAMADATFTFTTTTNLANNDNIFVQYPDGFFAVGVTPSASMNANSCTPTAFMTNQVTCKVNGAVSGGVVLTLIGITMGPVYAGK